MWRSCLQHAHNLLCIGGERRIGFLLEVDNSILSKMDRLWVIFERFVTVQGGTSIRLIAMSHEPSRIVSGWGGRRGFAALPTPPPERLQRFSFARFTGASGSNGTTLRQTILCR
jgi:hypothetical protein